MISRFDSERMAIAVWAGKRALRQGSAGWQMRMEDVARKSLHTDCIAVR